jgi:predicted kinase
LPCSGKTTLSKKLEKELNALRLTPDEWHIRLFGHDVSHPDHDRRHDTVEDLLWKVAASVLGHGVDVILDFGFWKRIERQDYRARAAALGVPSVIHFLDVSEEVLFRRLDIRNELAHETTAQISPALLREWLGHFQPPDDEELSRNGS